jgi:hypothetical protein
VCGIMIITNCKIQHWKHDCIIRWNICHISWCHEILVTTISQAFRNACGSNIELQYAESKVAVGPSPTCFRAMSQHNRIWQLGAITLCSMIQLDN